MRPRIIVQLTIWILDALGAWGDEVDASIYASTQAPSGPKAFRPKGGARFRRLAAFAVAVHRASARLAPQPCQMTKSLQSGARLIVAALVESKPNTSSKPPTIRLT
jgi:hypothetical protein